MARSPKWLVTTEPQSFGSGWLSGTVAAVLGIAAASAAFSMASPQWLSLPELREQLRSPIAVNSVQAAIIIACILGVLSLALRRTKTLGVVAIVTSTLAVLCLQFVDDDSSPHTQQPLGFGLDVFALTLIIYTAIFVPLERLWPRYKNQPTFREEWWTDLMWFLSSALLVQVTTFLVLTPAEAMQFVASPWLQQKVRELPLVVQFVAAVCIADFVQYWVHYACHRIPVLWRFHQVHHSAKAMDWLAGSRLHIIDAVLTRALIYAPLFLLGFDPAAIGAYLVFVVVQATFVHANVGFVPSWIEPWLATPRFHHWHHADTPADKNFAVHLPIYDRLFGTQHMPRNEWPQRYGLAGGKTGPAGFWRQLLQPFYRQPS